MLAFAPRGATGFAAFALSLLFLGGPSCKGSDDVVLPECGNAALESGERCDDGNTTSGDGCSSTCSIEAGWNCTTPAGGKTRCVPLAVCGDAVLESGEGCDDGNTTSGDGCSATCTIESGWDCTTPAGGKSTCLSLCTPPASPEVTPGSSQKVCQLMGDVDRKTGAPTLNLTWSRYQLYGTDLGASFEHGGKLWFLFGDSVPESGNPACGDSIATAPTSVDPLQCLPLTFPTQASGAYRSPIVPGIDLGCFNVPLHGVSTGGTMYVWFSTACATRSVLARSDDGGASFRLVHVLSDCACNEVCGPNGPVTASCANRYCRLAGVYAAVVPAASAGSLPGTGDRLLLFGSGLYRESDVYLAVTSLSTIEDPSTLRYFAGTDAVSCVPSWSAREADAVPIFQTAGENAPGSCVGELSVHWSDVLGRWVAMYVCENRLDARVAPFPWGPWSAYGVVLAPVADRAYCNYLFAPRSGCDSLSDPGRLTTYGGIYGPYPIPRFTSATPAGAAMYFTLSTWNPYNSILMRTEFVRTP
jgi:cysteine-rich repeat protein